MKLSRTINEKSHHLMHTGTNIIINVISYKWFVKSELWDKVFYRRACDFWISLIGIIVIVTQSDVCVAPWCDSGESAKRCLVSPEACGMEDVNTRGQLSACWHFLCEMTVLNPGPLLCRLGGRPPTRTYGRPWQQLIVFRNRPGRAFRLLFCVYIEHYVSCDFSVTSTLWFAWCQSNFDLVECTMSEVIS